MDFIIKNNLRLIQIGSVHHRCFLVKSLLKRWKMLSLKVQLETPLERERPLGQIFKGSRHTRLQNKQIGGKIQGLA